MTPGRAAFAALALAFALARPASGGTTEQSTPYGAFNVIVEVRTADPGEVPIMHVNTEWTKLRLRWSSADAALTADLIDNGRFMVIELKGYDCFSNSFYFAYRNRAGEPDLRWRLADALANLLKVCPRIPEPLRAAYIAEFERSEADYRIAVEAMKAQALLLFYNTLKRCLPKGPSFGGWDQPDCEKTGYAPRLRRSAARRRGR